jgi:hypothetical protein
VHAVDVHFRGIPQLELAEIPQITANRLDRVEMGALTFGPKEHFRFVYFKRNFPKEFLDP